MKHKFVYRYVQRIEVTGPGWILAKPVWASRTCTGDHYTLVRCTLNVYAKSERGTLFVINRIPNVAKCQPTSAYAYINDKTTYKIGEGYKPKTETEQCTDAQAIDWHPGAVCNTKWQSEVISKENKT